MTIIGIQSYGDLSQEYIDGHGLAYPIADDPDREIWDAYGMQFHPSWALIGADGGVIHRQVGRVVTPDAIAMIEEALATQ